MVKNLLIFFLGFSLTLVFAQWEPEQRLTFDPSVSQTSANSGWCVACQNDTVHVVWFDQRDGNYEIYYKKSTDNGANWSADLRLTNDPAESNRPSIAVSGDNLHVVWYDQRDGNYEIYYKNSTDNSVNWSQDTALTAEQAPSFFNSVAVGTNTVHVVWTDERDGNREIYYKRNPTGNTAVKDHGQIARERMPLASPTPFVCYTTISGYEDCELVVYDITGRKAGNYKGNMVGADLSPGIYFKIT